MTQERKPAPGNRRILLLNGPNLNLLGARDHGLYGSLTLLEIVASLHRQAGRVGLEILAQQSNHEGVMVDLIQKHACGDPTGAEKVCGIILNAGALTHTSLSIRDALEAAFAPAIEVHISNVHRREEFRHRSVLAAVCRGQIVGLGPQVYALALHAFALEMGLSEP